MQHRIILLAAAVILRLSPTYAHNAPPTKAQPDGWQYGFECCSLMDCRPLAEGDVSETPQGYKIKLTGEVIAYGDKRLKKSKDEYYHQCTHGGKADAVPSICLYTPDRGV